MGSCKENMKPSSSDKKGGILKGLLGKKKADAQTKASNFVDNIAEAESKLAQLIIEKQKDFDSEKGKERENAKKLALLERMGENVVSILELAEEYGEL